MTEFTPDEIREAMQLNHIIRLTSMSLHHRNNAVYGALSSTPVIRLYTQTELTSLQAFLDDSLAKFNQYRDHGRYDEETQRSIAANLDRISGFVKYMEKQCTIQNEAIQVLIAELPYLLAHLVKETEPLEGLVKFHDQVKRAVVAMKTAFPETTVIYEDLINNF